MEGSERAEKAAPSSRSWVVEMEKMLEDTDGPVEEMARWRRHSVYRVPEWIKKMTNSSAYQPRIVSLGPYHHGEPDLLPMEEHKRRAVLHLVQRSGKPLRQFLATIEEVAGCLQEAYDGLDDKYWCGANGGRFVEMMVADGCFLLEFARTLRLILEQEDEVDDDYAPNDPVFSYHGCLFLWPDIRSDMLLMENQLPLLVLQRLEAARCGTSPCDEHINNLVLGLLNCSIMEKGIKNLGLHPLDIFHDNLCGPRPEHKEWHHNEKVMPSAVELSEAGVQFRKSNTYNIRNVDFEKGVLTMPSVVIDSRREKRFLNLMAFERLHSNAGSDVTSFVFFMDNLIDSERDVALLRSNGLIENLMSSDTEVTKLFCTLSKGALLNPSSKLHDVQRKVNAHCKKPWNKWRANFVHTYLNNPWVFISLVAAVVLLVATFLQTIYTVVSFYNKG